MKVLIFIRLPLQLIVVNVIFFYGRYHILPKTVTASSK